MTEKMDDNSVNMVETVGDDIVQPEKKDSKTNQDVSYSSNVGFCRKIMNYIGPEPHVKIWFTFLPLYMSLLFFTLAFLIHYSLNNVGVAQSFIIFFEITIPILFVIYSIVLVVISLIKIRVNSKGVFYSASLFLSITFIFSLLCLFMNRGFVDGNYISTDYTGIYLLSLIVSTIDVFYIFNRIRGIVILMIGDYAKEK